MSKERAAKVMQEIFSKGTYEGDLLGINEGGEMSNTPRTDAEPTHKAGIAQTRTVNIAFARQLERELVEAQAEITSLKGENKSWAKVFERTRRQLQHKLNKAWDQRDKALVILRYYRHEIPLEHQPYMLGHEVDLLLKECEKYLLLKGCEK
jgi:hypothetical protein